MRGDTAQDNSRCPPVGTFTLVGQDGKSYHSRLRGTLGGHRLNRIYGCLDCRAALRAIARGGYVRHRVFFLDEITAIAAGYRPCAVCLPKAYRAWRSRQPGKVAEEARKKR